MSEKVIQRNTETAASS